MAELHIPVRVVGTGSGKERQWKALCSCRQWGPLADSPDQAELSLAHEHGAAEPEHGCTLCSRVIRSSPTDRRPPWQRYRAVEGPTGAWEYVCPHGGECTQRQLELEHQTLHGEPWLMTGGRGEDLVVSLNSDLDRAPFDMAGAIALYHLAQEECPRDWDDITNSARDRRALAAKVVALRAISQAAEAHRWHAMLAARKSGVSWRHLALLLGDDPEDLRQALGEFYRYTDWPWSGRDIPADIAQILAEDPPQQEQT